MSLHSIFILDKSSKVVFSKFFTENLLNNLSHRLFFEDELKNQLIFYSKDMNSGSSEDIIFWIDDIYVLSRKVDDVILIISGLGSYDESILLTVVETFQQVLRHILEGKVVETYLSNSDNFEEDKNIVMVSSRPTSPKMSPPNKFASTNGKTELIDLEKQLNNIKGPRRTIMDAYDKSTFNKNEPKVAFGTGSRPPLMEPREGPGPGAYKIKTTMSKLSESNFRTPSQFSIRGRTKFGDPNEKMLSKSSINEPGPAHYDLNSKFLTGKDPRQIVFPKGAAPKEKSFLAPGPGSYKPLYSMGKQVLSTKKDPGNIKFDKGSRPTLVQPGISEIGPGEYKPPSGACEPQIDSRKRTCATIKFGEGYRKGVKNEKFDFSEPSPGPGSYKLPGGVATITRGSPYRDSPSASLSGRNKFGSPW